VSLKYEGEKQAAIAVSISDNLRQCGQFTRNGHILEDPEGLGS
jgi:hypothetical protein